MIFSKNSFPSFFEARLHSHSTTNPYVSKILTAHRILRGRQLSKLLSWGSKDLRGSSISQYLVGNEDLWYVWTLCVNNRCCIGPKYLNLIMESIIPVTIGVALMSFEPRIWLSGKTPFSKTSVESSRNTDSPKCTKDDLHIIAVMPNCHGQIWKVHDKTLPSSNCNHCAWGGMTAWFQSFWKSRAHQPHWQH